MYFLTLLLVSWVQSHKSRSDSIGSYLDLLKNRLVCNYSIQPSTDKLLNVYLLNSDCLCQKVRRCGEKQGSGAQEQKYKAFHSTVSELKLFSQLSPWEGSIEREFLGGKKRHWWRAFEVSSSWKLSAEMHTRRQSDQGKQSL